MRQQKGMLTWRLSWEIIMGKFLKILSNSKKIFFKTNHFREMTFAYGHDSVFRTNLGRFCVVDFADLKY